MAMDDSMKAITLLIAEACVNSVIESLVQSSLSKENAQLRPGRLSAMGREWTVSYIPNPIGPKLEEEVKPPHVLTKEFPTPDPSQLGRPRKDVAAERGNKETWRLRWRCMLAKWTTCCWWSI